MEGKHDVAKGEAHDITLVLTISSKRARKAGEDMSAFCVAAILGEVKPRLMLYHWYHELERDCEVVR